MPAWPKVSAGVTVAEAEAVVLGGEPELPAERERLVVGLAALRLGLQDRVAVLHAVHLGERVGLHDHLPLPDAAVEVELEDLEDVVEPSEAASGRMARHAEGGHAEHPGQVLRRRR